MFGECFSPFVSCPTQPRLALASYLGWKQTGSNPDEGMAEDVHAKLGETKLLFQKLVTKSEKFITPEPEEFGRRLKAFLVEGDALLKLLEPMGYKWRHGGQGRGGLSR